MTASPRGARCGTVCAGLLAACDDARVLATSREPLAVAGEARYRLGPLTLPGPDQTGDGGGSEAVALFADRARCADPHFALDEQTAATFSGHVVVDQAVSSDPAAGLSGNSVGGRIATWEGAWRPAVMAR